MLAATELMPLGKRTRLFQRHQAHQLDPQRGSSTSYVMMYPSNVSTKRPEPSAVAGLTAPRAQEILARDEYLRPTLEDDRLLREFLPVWRRLPGRTGRTEMEWDELLQSTGPAAEPTEVERLQKEVSDLQDTVANLKRMLYERMTSDLEVAPTADVAIGRNDATTSRLPSGALDRTDRPYFESYAENEIHEIMLKDAIRTGSYRDFILESSAFKGKVVLDVGCGSGILSMFAARAGATHVYAVDASDIAGKAKLNVYDNGLQDKITVIQGKIEDVQLPVEKVDVIVSEWMGYALLYESMLDSILVARRRFLAEGGLIVPSQCTLLLAGLGQDAAVDSIVSFWDDVYGSSCPRDEATTERLAQDSR
jgi:protein arginine N-methyltransferase 3